MFLLSLYAQCVIGMVWSASSTYVPQTSVSIDGTQFRIDGKLTYEGLNSGAAGRLMNVRMINSVFEDENPETRPEGFDPEANTAEFIDSMDEYRSKGILAFTINLQGGFPGYEGAINSVFRPDGTLKEGYMARVARVIEAADARGMVILLGFFYQRQDQILTDEDAVRVATLNAASWVQERGYTNVMIEIANEYRHPGFDHQIILDEGGEVELMDLVRSVAPYLLVSTSGMGNAKFHPTLAKAVDFILIHGNGTKPEQYPERIEALKSYGKPIVFNEDWCISDDPRGVGDAIPKLEAAWRHGASWGLMNERRNQYVPFLFGIGRPDEGQNAKEDFEIYEKIAELVGVRSR